MSYAGPANPMNPNKSAPIIRRVATTPASHTERNTVFLAGVLLGAAVGAGVALLLAPQAGRVTRRRLVRSGRRITQHGRDVWHDTWQDAWHGLAHELRAAQRKSFSRRAASSL